MSAVECDRDGRFYGYQSDEGILRIDDEYGIKLKEEQIMNKEVQVWLSTVQEVSFNAYLKGDEEARARYIRVLERILTFYENRGHSKVLHFYCVHGINLEFPESSYVIDRLNLTPLKLDLAIAIHGTTVPGVDYKHLEKAASYSGGKFILKQNFGNISFISCGHLFKPHGLFCFGSDCVVYCLRYEAVVSSENREDWDFRELCGFFFHLQINFTACVTPSFSGDRAM